MKRSKIMLGLVALLLAGAGAFASANQPPQDAFYRVIENQPASCTEFPEQVNCTPGARTCKEDVGGVEHQLYDDEDCMIPLEEDSGF